jgi:hypothetical protein
MFIQCVFEGKRKLRVILLLLLYYYNDVSPCYRPDGEISARYANE